MAEDGKISKTPTSNRQQRKSYRYSLAFAVFAVVGFLPLYLFPMLREPETYEKVKSQQQLSPIETARQEAKDKPIVGRAQTRSGFSPETYIKILSLALIYGFALFILLKMIPYPSGYRALLIVASTIICHILAGWTTACYISSAIFGGFHSGILAWADYTWRYNFDFKERVEKVKGYNAVQILEIFQRCTQTVIWFAIIMFAAFTVPTITGILTLIKPPKGVEGQQPTFILLTARVIIMAFILSAIYVIGVVFPLANRLHIVNEALFRLGKNCDRPSPPNEPLPPIRR